MYQPNNNSPLLLHVCCAPCSGAVIARLIDENIRPAIYFYNPNIFPRQEYEARKESLISFVNKSGLLFIDADYTHKSWLDAVKGFEFDPERGNRCSICFDVRLQQTARYASTNGYSIFATTNGVSRWKDLKQVNASGFKAAKLFPGLRFWDRNWRQNDAQTLMKLVAEREKFYQQNYCGCEFSFKKETP